MNISLAKLEYESLSELQKELHITESVEEIGSDYHVDCLKWSWVTQAPSMFKQNKVGESHVDYTYTEKCSYLLYSYLVQKWPSLRVKKKYRNTIEIGWPHNMGTCIIEEAQLHIDEEIPQTINHVYCDIYFQFFLKGDRESHKVDIGNLECLEGWNSILPAYETSVTQPWYYCRDVLLALPFLYETMTTGIVHSYNFRNKIEDLLRMREKQGDKWVEIPCKLDYLDGVPSDGRLQLPELWGQFSYVSKEELEYNKCKVPKAVYWIDDVVILPATNPTKFNKSVSIDLQSTHPTKAIFWVAENVVARENRNFSNYTTDPSDLYKGWNPCKWVSLLYGKSYRLKELPILHVDRIFPKMKFPCRPCEPGYNAISISQDCTAINTHTGLVLETLKAQLVINLGESYSSYEVSDPASEYLLYVCMLVTRKLSFNKNKDGKYRVLLDISKSEEDSTEE